MPSAAPGITPAHAGKSVVLTRSSSCEKDHPRTRGEKFRSLTVSRARRGSPPHTRGKGLHSIEVDSFDGITPAHAGKSYAGNVCHRYSEDHPRTRGEKSGYGNRRYHKLGSPPHTRGKALTILLLMCRGRITPAHAGKRTTSEAISSEEKDHPRTRGEKILNLSKDFQSRGSPPHTRGKVCPQSGSGHIVRITPAHAGKSSAIAFSNQGWEDHPRTRGEKTKTDMTGLSGVGSPPHTRGKVEKLSLPPEWRRITPAHAGKRCQQLDLQRKSEDHPRTRGEKLDTGICREVIPGSPPHTRGKDPVYGENVLKTRITPAHAGKSYAGDVCHWYTEDHPRTRGEKILCMVKTSSRPGSPPHTRGKV